MISEAVLKLYPLPFASAFEAAVAAGVIYKNAAHRLGCQGVEVGTVLAVHVPATGHFKEDFIQQGSWLQGVVGSLITELGNCHSPEFVEDEGSQLRLRALVSRPDTVKDRGKVESRPWLWFHEVMPFKYMKRGGCMGFTFLDRDT